MLTIYIDTNRQFTPGEQDLWLEDKALIRDEACSEAHARSFAHFIASLGVSREPLMHRQVSSRPK